MFLVQRRVDIQNIPKLKLVVPIAVLLRAICKAFTIEMKIVEVQDARFTITA